MTRITSYNVCYTKLLRIGSAAQPGGVGLDDRLPFGDADQPLPHRQLGAVAELLEHGLRLILDVAEDVADAVASYNFV